MNILEYADDLDLDVEVVKTLCKKLDIPFRDEYTVLTEKNMIKLDNEIASDNFESELEEAEALKEGPSKVQKNKGKRKFKKTGDFKKDRKNIYKYKNKLDKQDVKDEIIYKKGTTVKELALLLEVSPSELIKKLINLGVMATINDSVNYDVAELLVVDYNKKLKKEAEADISNFEEFIVEDKEEDLVKRPPVVTIMGHVDHGKTSLLDAIRKTDVVKQEAGGITQGLSSYKINYKGETITFIDTPGHAAFTEMRMRGASMTDIIIIIIAADDGIKPQTEEVIDHAKAAKVPIIVAINKIDVEGANPEKVKGDLVKAGLTPEEWGGDIIVNLVSARTKEGIPELLDNILLVAEMSNLRANPKRYALGTVIESKRDLNLGPVASLLVQNGVLRLGDPIVVGTTYGKIRTLKNDDGENIIEALPSTPVEITGLDDVPNAGDRFMAFETEKEAKNIALKRKARAREASFENTASLSLDDLFKNQENEEKCIKILLKTDTDGSLEAIKKSLLNINVDGYHLEIVRGGVGAISDSDIVLAKATNSLIIGFSVPLARTVKDYAERENVKIKIYDIIYEMIEHIEKILSGKVEPKFEKKKIGEAEIRQIFKFSKVGNIAGCHVDEGIIKINSPLNLVRDGSIIYEGEIKTLQEEKNQVREVGKGKDCGITLDYQNFKVGDIIQVFEMKEVINE